jgi:ankyrin repeat protein
VELATLLLQWKADVNAKDSHGTTPLHDAVWKEHKKMIEFILAMQADVNAQDNNGDTPLHTAVLWGRREAVELLLSRNADLGVKNNRDRTPLEEAAASGRTGFVQLLTAQAKGASAGVPDGGTKKSDLELEKMERLVCLLLMSVVLAGGCRKNNPMWPDPDEWRGLSGTERCRSTEGRHRSRAAAHSERRGLQPEKQYSDTALTRLLPAVMKLPSFSFSRRRRKC